jgi:dTDP-glucose 4,6-dehydratase
MKPLPQDDLQAIVDAVDWEPLRGARILLTGGSGFIGRWMMDSFILANRQHNLKAMMFATMAHTQIQETEEVCTVIWDLTTGCYPNQWPGVITHCIHAACPSCAVPPVSDLEMFKTIINGTQNVMKWCAENEAKHVLYLSSGASVYRSDTPYGLAKKAAEMVCKLYTKDYSMQVSIARIYTLVGPGLPLDGHFAIGNFIRDAIAGRPVQVIGGASSLRSYLYISDAATRLWELAISPFERSTVGSPNIISIRDLAGLVGKVLHAHVSYTLGTCQADTYLPPSNAHLGRAPRVSLEDAILKTAQWNQEDL